ncbi:hypothetical protein BDV93DRAFT_543367 [Ceratobasidium sp. AG-I]|nr:hypothetical protein BDV93DRAFT_543367 [Ceratobasidium sp. AG-I]
METYANTNMNANTWQAPCDNYYQYPQHSHSLGATSGSSYSSGYTQHTQHTQYTQPEHDYYYGSSSASFDHTSFGLPNLTESPVEASLDGEDEEVEADAEVEADTEIEADPEYEPEAEQEAGSSRGKRTRQSSDDDEANSRKRSRRSSEIGERKRSSRACKACRKAKMKCMPGPSMHTPDVNMPCARCTTDNRPCEFDISKRGKPPIKKLAQLNWQVQHMDNIIHSLREALNEKRRTESRRSYSYPY